MELGRRIIMTIIGLPVACLILVFVGFLISLINPGGYSSYGCVSSAAMVCFYLFLMTGILSVMCVVVLVIIFISTFYCIIWIHGKFYHPSEGNEKQELLRNKNDL